MAAHPPLSGPAIFDASKSSGFTAVNGEQSINTSFRPLAQEESIKVAPARPRSIERSPASQLNSGAKHSRTEDPDAGRASSVHDLTVVDSPPAKRPRLSADDDRSSPDSRSSGSALHSSASQTPPIESNRESRNSALPPSDAPPPRPSETRRNPQEVRPETSRNLQEQLVSHLSSSRARDAAALEEANAREANQSLAPAPYISSSSGAAGTPNNDRSRRKREFSHRTKSGCHTCRRRKKKCDEAKPSCQNCLRGKFTCEGYGPMPKGESQRRANATKIQLHLQAKPMEITSPQRPGAPQESYWQLPSAGTSSYPPPYEQSRHGQHPPMPPQPVPGQYPTPHHDPRDNWLRQQPYADAQHIHLQHNKLHHVDYNPVPPPFHSSDSQSRQSVPDPFGQVPYRHQGQPPFPLHEFTSESRRGSQLPPMQTSLQPQMPSSDREGYEREQMLIGQPYRHWKDSALITDRTECKTAVDLYNRAALPSESIGADERAKRFSSILDPNKRTYRRDPGPWTHKVGSCGARTVVESPFYVDYGYNLHIGSEVVIHPNCYVQDPCDITIGDRCVIGPNVKFYGMTAPLDPKGRGGALGHFLGGSIRVEDDCFIGGDVVILPYRVIGKGAVVGSGSVVTKNVKPGTIVAGNPAKRIGYVGEQVNDRHMRSDIQEENDEMKEEMKRKRFGQSRPDIGMPPMMSR